jgi:predicted NUDIX family phosphoesterase
MARVLCVTSRFVRAKLAPGFTSARDIPLSAILESSECGFLDRDEAETREDHKQICSYAVIRYGASVLHYGRGAAGGEGELHGRRSIGIGGHVEETDINGGVLDGEAIQAAALREVNEEIHFLGANGGKSPFHAFDYAGLVHHDDDPVGRRHVGVVYEAVAVNGFVVANDEAIERPQFSLPLALTRLGGFERWSEILLDVLSGRGF